MNLTFTSKHYVTFALLLTALGVMVSALPNWGAALTPQFIGAAALSAGAVLKAMYQAAPDAK